MDPRRQRALYFVIGFLVLCAVSVWTVVLTSTPRHTLTVAFLDIGQGDAIYIESPTGVRMLVDGGPGNGALLRALPKVMPQFNTTLDAIVETHPDADHMGGFVDLLKRYTVKNFIEPGIVKHNTTTDTLEAEVDSEHISRHIARRGMWLDLGGGAHLDVLFPDYDVTHMDPTKDNDGCVVAHLVYGKTSVILTCDATKLVEDHLIQIASSTELRSDILKVGHHGSKYSTSPEFVAAVHPAVAVISVGAHNRYGHPNQEAMGVLSAAGVPILRTDQEGTITFESNGQEFIRK